MSTQGSRKPAKRKPADVSASVRLDVATYSRVSAAAANARVPKSTWMAKVITEAVQGIVVIDRRKSAGPVESSGEVDRPEEG